MKNLFFVLTLLSTACYHSKPTADDNRGNASGLISFQVWNNSLLPHQYTIVGYNSGEKETFNWTNGLFLLPGTYHTFSCPIGTKIYLANNTQTSTVMGGGSIRNDSPFISIKAGDAGKWFKLNRGQL